ncbi:MAG: NAD(P)H-hydrate dehydratase [Tannerella sp.]|jgi:NAD(P)H-hydrate epimerase|nr:NAD(P)H-hydrate dehydratase [Tannerella sp.]
MDKMFNANKISDLGDVDYTITDSDAVRMSLRERPEFAHKGTFGHALLMAGGRCRMGAAVLAAKACLRSGAGLLTVHIPQCGEIILQTAVPEAMLSLDHDSDSISTLPDIARYQAVGIGPAIGIGETARRALETLLCTATQPLVIDADAITILAHNSRMLDILPANTVLTPHAGEFDRLVGASVSVGERINKAVAMAARYRINIVLKGAYTAVCTGAGKVRFNTTGNPGMATAGSGDVLTGIILGLLAQGYEPEQAAVTGVYLHGLAGDIAAAEASQESLVAGDIIRSMGKAFATLKS